MRMFVKAFAVYLALLIVGGLSGKPALAESAAGRTAFSAKGVVESPTAVTVFAPMGGQIEDFAWAVGDRVEEGALAFSLRPTMVYAAADGVVTGLRAEAGDFAADVMAQYGALCYVERQDIWHVKATVTSTSGDPEKRDMRIGQVQRVQYGSGDSKVRGEGTVISVHGKDFVLEMEQGDFELEDDVKVYLGSSKDNATADQIGNGTIARADALPLAGDGIIATVLVSEGERVTRGQPLFILDAATARYEAEQQVQPKARFSRESVISEILVQPGQFVQQGQAVMTLSPVDALEATLEVDELDIAKVRVGDTVRVSVDAYRQERIGTVREIRSVGRIILDTTKFLVRVSFEKSDDLMIGMHVTAYWD